MAMAILAILLTIYFRVPMLKLFGFYEPDGFYHYSVIRAAVANGFRVPYTLSISGWPSPAQVTEPAGLYWVTLLPYALLSWSGISYYSVERLVPVLFGVLDVIGSFLLIRYLSKSNLLGALVMFFVALSGGDEARTSALIYRGDGFITIFLLGSLIAFVEVFRSPSPTRKLIFGLLSGFMLSLGNVVWNGGAFAVGVYVGSFFLILAFAFVFSKSEMLESLKYLLIGALFWFALTSLYQYTGWTLGQTFMGTQFFYLFAPMAIGWGIAYAMTNRTDLMPGPIVDIVKWKFHGPASRAALMLAVAAVMTVIVLIVGSSFINTVLVNNGFTTSGNSNVAKTSGNQFAATIQELQPPTPGFLFASFGVNIYSTLPTLAIYLYSYVGGVNVFFLITVLSFIPYLFMQVYDSSGIVSGNARFRFDVNPTMLVIIVYFVVTAYLQMHAIRFNSLISIPVAMLSAYTIYWLIAYSRTNEGIRSTITILLLVLVIGASIGTQALNVLPPLLNSQGSAVIAGALLIIAALALLSAKALYNASLRGALMLSGAILIFSVVYALIQQPAISQYPTIMFFDTIMVISLAALIVVEYIYKMNQWYGMAIVLMVFVLLYYNVLFTSNLSQADLLNQQFFSAMSWMKNNTPGNAVVLTLWPDGSVVEGLANRTSVTDSVGSQNYVKADAFALWLLNQSDDPGFLTGNLSDRPGYLLVRSSWMVETSGIFQEANATPGVNLDMAAYSYVKFGSFSANVNSSAVVYKFLSPAVNGNIGLGAYIYILNGSSGHAIVPYLATVDLTTGRSTGKLGVNSVIFHNESNYEGVPVQGINSTTSGYTILINYSSIPRNASGVPNVTGAMAVAPYLSQSNMFKFLFLCGYTSCAWDNNVASLQLVYANSDSRIFKINYNSTA